MRKTAEFYLSILKKEVDGLYHTYNTSVYEGTPLFKDSITDLVTMRALFKALLDCVFDETERRVYADALEHLSDYNLVKMDDDEICDGKLAYGIGKGKKVSGDGRVFTVGIDNDGNPVRRHKTLETNTSITSRVSSHLLERQLENAGNVLIMSHANPDFDAIGSMVGTYRLCTSILTALGRPSTPVHIVTNKNCDTFRICAAHLATLPEYERVFVDKAAAQQLVTTRTTLVITDVSNPQIFEAPALVGSIPSVGGVSAIAVIDHHRLEGELPFTPFLHYIETTKSSASEIVAEILQQSDYADTLHKEEANLLLGGIMLDTHNFTRSAGAQTFEVTYYLYGRNAHTATAREFFNESMDELQVAGDFDAHAHLYSNVFAITWLSANHTPSPEDRIAASKAADKLLGLRNVEASFAMAVVGGGIAISARSKGRINVQLIMEKLDGGGHFDMAGAQVSGDIAEAYRLLCAAIDEYKLQFPEQFEDEE